VPDRTTAAKKSPSVRRQSASAPPFFTPSCPAFNGSVTRPVTSLGLPCPAAFGLRWKVCTKVRPRPHDDVRNAAILCGIRLANRCRASVPHGPCEAVSAPAGTAPVSPKSSLLSLKSHRLQVSHLTWAATPLLPRPPQILSLPISFSLRPGDVTEVTVTSQGARSPPPPSAKLHRTAFPPTLKTQETRRHRGDAGTHSAPRARPRTRQEPPWPPSPRRGDTRGRAAHRAPGGRGGRSHRKGDGRCPGADPAPPCAQRSEGRAQPAGTRTAHRGRISHHRFPPAPAPAETSPFPGFPASSFGSTAGARAAEAGTAQLRCGFQTPRAQNNGPATGFGTSLEPRSSLDSSFGHGTPFLIG
jgi:hypothetical protein